MLMYTSIPNPSTSLCFHGCPSRGSGTFMIYLLESFGFLLGVDWMVFGNIWNTFQKGSIVNEWTILK